MALRVVILEVIDLVRLNGGVRQLSLFLTSGGATRQSCVDALEGHAMVEAGGMIAIRVGALHGLTWGAQCIEIGQANGVGISGERARDAMLQATLLLLLGLRLAGRVRRDGRNVSRRRIQGDEVENVHRKFDGDIGAKST